MKIRINKYYTITNSGIIQVITKIGSARLSTYYMHAMLLLITVCKRTLNYVPPSLSLSLVTLLLLLLCTI